ncbi:YitT family protein [Paenibacillus senegalensis]|uniref:YitT family protein n=1 Tax=Paenibacillus senegalensis TaxID=1465766 RepID=UPI000474668D|nr:YitT family protein [Paenibacillus senegalensis]
MAAIQSDKPLSVTQWILRLIFITLGAVLMAVALELFLVPNTVIDGGITGISIVLSQITPVFLGVYLVVINLPFLIIGRKLIGNIFAVLTLYGITVMSVCTVLLHHTHAFTDDRLLAVLFGGITLGLGVGLVLRFGGALDGSEIVAILISKKTKFPVGQIILIINVFIFAIAGFVLGWDAAMYSIVTYYIASKVMDIVVEGMNETKSVTIVSRKYEEIAQAISDRLGRTSTMIYAEGGFSKEEIKMIYCVVSRLELSKLKSVVHEIDRGAFVAIETVSDVTEGALDNKYTSSN